MAEEYKELVRLLKDKAERFDYDGWVDTAMVMEKAADAIEELTAVAESYKRSMEAWADEATRAHEMMPRWIHVTERLPEDGSDVLAYVNNSRITAANYDKGTWQDCVMGRLYLTEEGFVTHWMPLPEPPKEEV